jgi:hypothetical protein
MLTWERHKRWLDAMTAEIEAEVLKIQKTQVVGSVRVTYSGGRATYDYETPAKYVDGNILAKYAIPVDTTNWDAVAKEVPEVVAKHTVRDFTYAWKDICAEAKIDPIVVSKTEPTAKIKLED